MGGVSGMGVRWVDVRWACCGKGYLRLSYERHPGCGRRGSEDKRGGLKLVLWSID